MKELLTALHANNDYEWHQSNIRLYVHKLIEILDFNGFSTLK